MSTLAAAQTEPTDPRPGKPIRTTLAYAPLIELDATTRAISACGLQITVLRDEQTLVTTTLAQEREGDDTRVTWCSTPRELLQLSPATGVAALEVRGAARLETPIALPMAAETAGCATVEESSLLFQRLFVGGGTLRIALEGQPTLSITLPRPLPSELSRAYLNCAGDLFRPEDASAE